MRIGGLEQIQVDCRTILFLLTITLSLSNGVFLMSDFVPVDSGDVLPTKIHFAACI